jgi:hypothetical protein
MFSIEGTQTSHLLFQFIVRRITDMKSETILSLKLKYNEVILKLEN